VVTVGSDDRIAVGNRLPFDSIPRRGALLVEGPFPASAPLISELLTAGREKDEATVLVSTERPPDAFDPPTDRFGLVAVGIEPDSDAGPGPATYPFPVAVVPDPRDLADIGVQRSRLADLLTGSDGAVRVGVESLSALLEASADPRSVFRFLNASTGRVTTDGGVGVYHVDPAAHDDRTLTVLRGYVDGRVVVRDGELCVHGILDPEG
jgi:hypothetical protein